MNRMIVSSRPSSIGHQSLGPMLLSLLVGAAAGALLVALNTNKPDLEQERRAKSLARCAKRGPSAVTEDIEGLMDDWKVSAPLGDGDGA